MSRTYKYTLCYFYAQVQHRAETFFYGMQMSIVDKLRTDTY